MKLIIQSLDISITTEVNYQTGLHDVLSVVVVTTDSPTPPIIPKKNFIFLILLLVNILFI